MAFVGLKVGGFANNMSNDLWGFGHDMIISFAEGMATAISAVLDVLIQIGLSISPTNAGKILTALYPNDWKKREIDGEVIADWFGCVQGDILREFFDIQNIVPGFRNEVFL